jgi:hypothetical protein
MKLGYTRVYIYVWITKSFFCELNQECGLNEKLKWNFKII